MINTFSFVAENGVPFCARIVQNGDGYGTYDADKQIWDRVHNSNDALIEFYDERYLHAEFGQFITKYNVSYILKHDPLGVGLCLNSHYSDWDIDFKSLRLVIDELILPTKFDFLKQDISVDALIKSCVNALPHIENLLQKQALIKALREFENCAVPTTWSPDDVDSDDNLSLSDLDKRDVIHDFVSQYSTSVDDWDAIQYLAEQKAESKQ